MTTSRKPVSRLEAHRFLLTLGQEVVDSLLDLQLADGDTLPDLALRQKK